MCGREGLDRLGLHDRTGRLEKEAHQVQTNSYLHDRTGRLEKIFDFYFLTNALHDRTGRLEIQ